MHPQVVLNLAADPACQVCLSIAYREGEEVYQQGQSGDKGDAFEARAEGEVYI